MTFERDVMALRPSMLAFAISLCGLHDRAEDLVQDTMVKALTHRDSFVRGTNLKAWLFTILRNTYFSEYRKSARRGEVSLEDAPEGRSYDIVDARLAQEDAVAVAELAQFVGDLPPDYQQIVVLLAQGWSTEEIASDVLLPIGTVKSRVYRIRKRLRVAMEGSSRKRKTRRTKARRKTRRRAAEIASKAYMADGTEGRSMCLRVRGVTTYCGGGLTVHSVVLVRL